MLYPAMCPRPGFAVLNYIDLTANLYLNGDPGTSIAFPSETCGLMNQNILINTFNRDDKIILISLALVRVYFFASFVFTNYR
jgi:hypothetical protein